MELVLHHPSGTYNFVVARRFLENLCTPIVHTVLFYCYISLSVNASTCVDCITVWIQKLYYYAILFWQVRWISWFLFYTLGSWLYQDLCKRNSILVSGTLYAVSSRCYRVNFICNGLLVETDLFYFLSVSLHCITVTTLVTPVYHITRFWVVPVCPTSPCSQFSSVVLRVGGGGWRIDSWQWQKCVCKV
jgi:hypothetical protein